MLRLPILMILNLLRLLSFLWASLWFNLGRWLRRKHRVYVELKLEPSYALGNADRGVRRWLSPDSPSFMELRRSIKRLERAREVEGVIVKVEGVSVGPARAAELAALLERLRAAGKHVIAHADSVSARDLVVLSAADDVLMPPPGRFYVFGYRFDEVLAVELLDRLGIDGQFIHLGEFKTATHRFHKHQMTAPQRLMLTSLHEQLTAQLLAHVASARGLEPEAVRELLDAAPLDATTARRGGLLSDEIFFDDIGAWLAYRKATDEDELLRENDDTGSWRVLEEARGQAELLPSQDDVTSKDATALLEHADAQPKVLTMKMERYLNSRPERWRWIPLLRRWRYIGVLDLSGAITMANEGGAPVGGGLTIKPDEVTPALQQLRDDPACAGVLLHINSPGGSALASDLIWREIHRTRQVMPVVSYCSDVAASGGYYLACGGDRIVCQPSTLTGSIGVIVGKVSFGRALQKIDVNVESIYDHDAALFTSPFHTLPSGVMESLREDARAFYRRFLERVGQARAIERHRLHRYARGRVYTGKDAHDRNLVDELGGFERAVALICEMCNLPAETTPLSYVEHRKRNLRDVLSGSLLRAPSALDAVGLERLLEPAKVAAWFEREPMLALMPLEVTLE